MLGLQFGGGITSAGRGDAFPSPSLHRSRAQKRAISRTPQRRPRRHWRKRPSHYAFSSYTDCICRFLSSSRVRPPTVAVRSLASPRGRALHREGGASERTRGGGEECSRQRLEEHSSGHTFFRALVALVALPRLHGPARSLPDVDNAGGVWEPPASLASRARRA